ncbi:MAG: hypothetical protein AAF215_17160 [Cyanobacteria bacterium P01_A01_bin.123]
MAWLLIGLLIGLVVAALIYGWQQQQNRRQKALLRQAQYKNQQLSKSHDQHLASATKRLRQNYEARLTETIEHYQDQLALRNAQLQEEYEARISVLGMNHDAANPAIAVTGSDQLAQTEHPPASLSPEVKALEEEYNQRLKEVAHRLQKLYEKRYANKLAQIQAKQSQLKQDYNQQLAKTIEHYQDQFALRLAELEAEYETRVDVVKQSQVVD